MTRRVGVICAALAVVAAFSGAASADPVVVNIVVERSRFVPATVTVPAGVPVLFRVENRDPIAHEFILGTAAEHARHERAPGLDHDGEPGAASLGIGETATIPFTVARGKLLYACHVPGHYAYGMTGVVHAR